MKNLKIYEEFEPEGMVQNPMETGMETGMDDHYEVESTEFVPTTIENEGSYIVTFQNSDGEDTTIEIGTAAEPEFTGDSMVSEIDVIANSASDGKEYSVMGYYEKIDDGTGAYELKKVLLEEL